MKNNKINNSGNYINYNTYGNSSAKSYHCDNSSRPDSMLNVVTEKQEIIEEIVNINYIESIRESNESE